jgi:hypothetical protein
MWNDRYTAGLWGRAAFDPTGGLLTAGLMVAGAAAAAGGTLAGGSAAAQAGKMEQAAAAYKATQLRQNAGLAIRGAQTQMADTQTKTGLLTSSSTARAAASGVDAGVGSPGTNVGDIAKRGSFFSLMDLWKGQSEASGLDNEATAAQYSGEMARVEGEEKQNASYLSAAGTLAGGAGSAFGAYGKMNNPTAAGASGANLG